MCKRGVGRVLSNQTSNVGERLDRADLVVREHDRHERDVGVEGSHERIEIDHAARIDRDHTTAEGLDGIEDRVVLDGRARDDTLPAIVSAEHRQVVGLGATAREDDLARLGAERLGHDLTGFVDGTPGVASE